MDLKNAVIEQLGLKRKDHGVTTICISHSFGVVNGVVVHEEDAMTPEELAYKHEMITDGLFSGLWGNEENRGTVRQMKDQFIDVMAEAGGDLAKAMEGAPWKKGKEAGKGKVPAKR